MGVEVWRCRVAGDRWLSPVPRGVAITGKYFGTMQYHHWMLPTNASPGSEEKIHVLTERWALGLRLFHPDDFPIPLLPKESLQRPHSLKPGGRRGRSQPVKDSSVYRLPRHVKHLVE